MPDEDAVQIARRELAYNAAYNSMRHDPHVWHEALWAAIPKALAAAESVSGPVGVAAQPTDVPADDPNDGLAAMPRAELVILARGLRIANRSLRAVIRDLRSAVLTDLADAASETVEPLQRDLDAASPVAPDPPKDSTE